MEIPEAIKLIQEMKSWMPSDNKNFDKEREAIDTVVAFCEKQLQCDCVIGWEGDMPITFKMCDNCKSKI